MTGAWVIGASALFGAGAALAWSSWALRRPPRRVRRNVSGRLVPLHLGPAVVAGGAAGLAVALLGRLLGQGVPRWEAGAATALCVALLGGAGAFDDSRGDERPRGFAGHSSALRDGRLTGGLVKAVAGALAGVAAGLLTADGSQAVEIALLVPLTANLLNLLDRAPGRAGKLALVLLVPLVLWGERAWAAASAGVAGAVAAMLYFDLRERAMLGDLGANAIGGVVGLGLGLSLEEPARLAVLLVVTTLNAASERWSFSRAIERFPPLRAFDAIGRKSASPE